MLIGIDASRAFVDERTGTENYSYELITQMLRLTTAKKHTFVLFIRPNVKIPKELDGYSNVTVKLINFPVLWTQVGLALETWVTKLDILWIPAHTLPVLRNRSIKTIVTIHGLEYKYLPQYNNLLQRWYLPLSTYYAARRADRLICVSESTKRDLIAETGIDIEKTTVIYEGADMDRKSVGLLIRKAVMERYGIEDKKYILFVGTVQPRKNVGSLITAFAIVRQAHPDYKLVIAGGIGWEAEQDLAAPDKLGISDRVIFTGRVSPELLQALYQGASVYAQPSWTEGFGLPVLEAMAHKAPVVVSSGGALPEVVGDAGIIVSLDGGRRMFVSRLASAISDLLNDPRSRELLKQRGLERVRQFSWKSAADQTLKYLTTG
ncbi:glycosyltransferase family 1 protein [Candidatus Microgenomates bacterium]|nr:glycosyltransferase family 1 protein [Candidatus Microgenomates bacterium CPR3]RIK50958.1 MAG: glycosyltransferase family 1 protein [Candidatus Microgenomates bacterium]